MAFESKYIFFNLTKVQYSSHCIFDMYIFVCMFVYSSLYINSILYTYKLFHQNTEAFHLIYTSNNTGMRMYTHIYVLCCIICYM